MKGKTVHLSSQLNQLALQKCIEFWGSTLPQQLCRSLSAHLQRMQRMHSGLRGEEVSMHVHVVR